MHMATLQVKRVPDDLYAAARQRAESEGLSLSQYTLRLIERDLALPTLTEWLDELPRRRPIDIDIEKLMDDVRAEFEG
jgi:hypothetical protein